MQKCRYCGADLPENTRFCGRCGSVQDALVTDAAATSRNTPPQFWVPESGTIPSSWPPSSTVPAQGNMPAWFSNVQASATPPPPSTAENEDKDRRGVPPWSPLYGAALAGDVLLGSGQAFPPGAPIVQGTPQIGSVPTVAGSPPSTNIPFSHPGLGAGNTAPASSAMQGPANAAPISYPIQVSANWPVGNPTQGPVNPPVSHPVQRPQPRPGPPEEPGKHSPHEPHRHRDHRTQHKSHRVNKANAVGGSTVKTILVVVTVVAVVAAGGIATAAHFLSLPQPLISISSKYRVGNTPAGANGTILRISGQNFSNNSPITFLLDGHAAPGNSGTRSDSNGTFSADVTITGAWSAGNHTLTARDASNDSPKNSVSVTIVQPGQANTPGPNGAPPDDATFSLKVTNADNIADPFSKNTVLIVTGHPDPEGGTVCSPDDHGQSFTFNETTTNERPFTKTLTATCSGTYKAGQISFIETSTSIKISYQSNGVNVHCALNNPTVDLRLTGAYVGNNTFSGKVSSPYFPYTCQPQGYSFWHNSSQGITWTGTIVKQ